VGHEVLASAGFLKRLSDIWPVLPDSVIFISVYNGYCANPGAEEEYLMEDDTEDREIDVIAYSGYKANERPLYLVVAQQKLEVREVLDRWYGQVHDYFKVMADDGRTYLLKWHRLSDTWFLAKGAGHSI
jgi:hypothetical protein